jgi:hypothetical protein
VQHGRVIDLNDRAQLVLGVALIPDQSLPVTGKRAQFGQQRRRHCQRTPVPVLMAQRVRQHERVERIRVPRRDPVALPGPRGHLWRDAEQPVSLRLGATRLTTPPSVRSRRRRSGCGCAASRQGRPGQPRHARTALGGRSRPADRPGTAGDESYPSRSRRTARRPKPTGPAKKLATQDPFPDMSPDGRPGWNLITALEAQLPLATTRPASTRRDRSACGPQRHASA